MDFKKNEIREYFNDFIEENSNSLNDNDFIEDIHYHCFNTDYYIIGTYKATEWLENQVFKVINFIKEYEMWNFGKVTTDFSDPEKVVNMYVYIIGEEIVHEYKEKNNLYE
jgi:hypothetical protein